MGMTKGIVTSSTANGAALHPNDGTNTWAVGLTVGECLGNVKVNICSQTGSLLQRKRGLLVLISGDRKGKLSWANLVKAIKDEQAHWVHDFLFNDVDKTTATMPHLALADEFLNVILIQFQFQVEVFKEMLANTRELSVHDL